MNTGLINALQTSPNIKGIGLTMESIETNPVVYDLFTDLTWRKTTYDLDNWIQNYTLRRYGQASQPAMAAWKYLQYSVYNCNTNQEGTSGSILASIPALKIDRVSCCATVTLYYNPTDLFQAWKLLLSSNLTLNTFEVDLTSVTIQVLSNIALGIHQVFFFFWKNLIFKKNNFLEHFFII